VALAADATPISAVIATAVRKFLVMVSSLGSAATERATRYVTVAFNEFFVNHLVYKEIHLASLTVRVVR
jgi:hypothetical protein